MLVAYMISLFPRHSADSAVQLKSCCLLPRKCRSFNADIEYIYVHMYYMYYMLVDTCMPECQQLIRVICKDNAKTLKPWR